MNNEQKPDSFSGSGGEDNSQFGNQSGFGNSTFGGNGGSAFNSQANSTFGAAGNSKFGGGGGAAPNSEFGAGGFGGNSSVSQIFKEGGFGEDEKKKRTIVFAAAGVAVLVVLGAVYYLFLGDDGADTSSFQVGNIQESLPVDDFANTGVGESLTPEGGLDDFAAGNDALLTADEEAALLEEPALPTVEEEGTAAADGAFSEDAMEPLAAAQAPSEMGNVSSWQYNAELGGPEISVTPGAMVEVSRQADFSSLYVFGSAPDGSFRIPNPPPGVVYWREQGIGTINEIQVTPPPALSMNFSAPASIIAGETLSWSSAGVAAYYRVEFATDPGFQNIAAAVSTTGTQAAIDGIASGSYFVRVGGLNTAAGRFEYSTGASVTVQ